ncbi:FeoA family protein [Acetoanaerobium noterae]|mgnify:FL=1|uniref:FeoA family protein n=1 Tax=Acetoanaerobium noterae TaxID=745369 RepID=UPI002ED44C88
MENLLRNISIPNFFNRVDRLEGKVMNLSQAKLNTSYIVKDIKTNDEEIKNFLFTLGCYEGESVTIVSVLAEIYVISVKDARYSIDKDLAEAILI